MSAPTLVSRAVATPSKDAVTLDYAQVVTQWVVPGGSAISPSCRTHCSPRFLSPTRATANLFEGVPVTQRADVRFLAARNIAVLADGEMLKSIQRPKSLWRDGH